MHTREAETAYYPRPRESLNFTERINSGNKTVVLYKTYDGCHIALMFYIMYLCA